MLPLLFLEGAQHQYSYDFILPQVILQSLQYIICMLHLHLFSEDLILSGHIYLEFHARHNRLLIGIGYAYIHDVR